MYQLHYTIQLLAKSCSDGFLLHEAQVRASSLRSFQAVFRISDEGLWQVMAAVIQTANLQLDLSNA